MLQLRQSGCAAIIRLIWTNLLLSCKYCNTRKGKIVKVGRGLERVKNTSESDIYFEQILILAQETGFFSVWMEIFRDDEVVKEGLAAAFKGTKKEYVLG